MKSETQPLQERRKVPEDLVSLLESLEIRLEGKLDSLRAGFISWKALVLVILPIAFGGAAWLMSIHQANPHVGAVSHEELAAVESARSEAQQAHSKALEKLNDRLENFSEAVQGNSLAVERLSTTIEFAVERQQEE